MTRRALAFILAGAATAAIVAVVLVSALGSDASTHDMSDGSRMDGTSMPSHTMQDGSSMSGMDMDR